MCDRRGGFGPRDRKGVAVKKTGWIHLVFAAGVSSLAMGSTSAAASPPVGTISPFSGNISTSPCINPEGLSIDLQGNFYTGSASSANTATNDGQGAGAVCQLAPSGELVKSIPIPAGPGGVVSLLGVLFRPPHTLFALDFANTLDGGVKNGRVLSVNTVSGAVTTIASGFSFPNGIAEDFFGNLYIADSFLGTITRMAQDGSHKTVWSSSSLLQGDPTAALPIGANDIAFDFSFQNLYVTNTNYRLLVRIPVERDGSAGTATVFAAGSTIDTEQGTTNALDGADGITFDLFGNLYIAANASAEIHVISPTAQLVARYTSTNPPVDVPASLVFVGNQLYFTNLSLYDGGINSAVDLLQAPTFGLPPLPL
jgi:hypothetical protein